VRFTKRAVEVFAVGSSDAQLIVRQSVGRIVAVADTEFVIKHATESVSISGLSPATSYPVHLDNRRVTTLRTLAVTGTVHAKIATISDLHVGEPGFAFLPRLLSSTDPAQAHPMMCLRAAIAEINAWQPDLVVAKGDLAHRPTTAFYNLVAHALDELHAPLVLLPGNHDGGNRQGVSIAEALAPHGLNLVLDSDTHDLPGVRVIALNTMQTGVGPGWLEPDRVTAVLDAARTGRPVMLFTHHQFMRHRVAHYWPPGIPVGAANSFLRQLTDINENVFVSSGHTHRNRRYRRNSATLTEVGSTKDHPGVWARYEIYDNSVAQVIRRIADPAVLAWTEDAARAVGTIWGRWSQGRLRDRCFVHAWPQPGRDAPM
jgi:3',5'-cyclic-AMP phosphodiesterase